jgi:hypothetical protein
MDRSRDSRSRVKCMLVVYSIVKSTHLYSLAGNFIIWQVFTPCRPLGSTALPERVSATHELQYWKQGWCPGGDKVG